MIPTQRPPRAQALRCPTCLGMGYKGRWRQTAKGKRWKLECCRRCDGRGEIEPRRTHVHPPHHR